MAIAQRDDTVLAEGLASWAEALDPARGRARTSSVGRPSAGWSNETVLATVEWDDRSDDVVVRLPPVVASFPGDTLRTESIVLDALSRARLPVPRPIALEPDLRWLGAPFLVMTRVSGRPVGAAPSRDPWLVEAPPQRQRFVQEQFLATLAMVHRLDWRAAGLSQHLRGADGALATEVDWWSSYVDWAADGSPARRLVDHVRWCREHVPATEPPASLCWGDARLGNVMYDDGGALVALIDWELASIGPAEMDLAWYLALEELTDRYARASVPGFMAHDDAVAHFEAALGRRVRDLEWHEVFALVRSVAINDRQARLAAVSGIAYPGVAGDDNPVLGWVDGKVEQYEQTERST